MTINNITSSAANQLQHLYKKNMSGGKTDLKTIMRDALPEELFKDKVTIGNNDRTKKNKSTEYGSDEWLDMMMEDLKKQEEQNEIQGIINKLYMGSELSAAEMEVLEEKSPELYRMAVEAKRMGNEMEKELQTAKSKEDVDRIKTKYMQMASASSKSSSSKDSEMLAIRTRIMIGKINKVSADFYKSDDYAKLPDKTKEEGEYGILS